MADRLHMLGSLLLHGLRAKRGGHGVHSPYAYALCENVFYSRAAFYDFKTLDAIRSRLLNDDTALDTGGFGAGSHAFRSARRRVSAIARKGISRRNESELLYRLANYTNVKTCIELGTSVGLNTLYLALQNPRGTVYTIEGSAALCEYARALANESGVSNIRFLQGPFDDVLPTAVPQTEDPVLVYVDGDHSREATLRYFNMLLPLAREQNVFVFDDIHWSRGMTDAWRILKNHPAVQLSITAFRCGYLFFRPEIREKADYRFWV